MHTDSGQIEIGADDCAGTRQRIIVAARDEFARFGFDGARVDRMAKSAAVNKAMLYYHFQSKENLYSAVMKDFFAIIIGRVSTHIASSVSLEQALDGLVGIHSKIVTDYPQLRPIWLRELAAPHGDIFATFAEAMTSSGFTEAVRAGMQTQLSSGQFRQVDLRQAMISFVAMSLGYHLMAPIMDRIWNIKDRESFIEDRRKAIVDLFLYGVKAR